MRKQQSFIIQFHTKKESMAFKIFKKINFSLFLLLVLGFSSGVIMAACSGGLGHIHSAACSGKGGMYTEDVLGGRDGFGGGLMGGYGYGMSAQLQEAYTLKMLLQFKAELEKEIENDSCDEDDCADGDVGHGNYPQGSCLNQNTVPHKHKKTKLTKEDNTEILKSINRKIKLINNEQTYGNAIINGLGSGICGKHYRPTGNPGYDMLEGILGKMSEPAGMVIAENGKSFWTKVFNVISNKWNTVSNKCFATATFTTRELEAWKSDVRDLVKAFEEAYKRASGSAASSHGLALRSGIFTEGCADDACADAACAEVKEVAEDPALKARKMFCQLQIQNILNEVAVHKMKSRSNKGLCERAGHVEIALQALRDCIGRQTSLNELNSAAIFDEICVWRDLTTSALNSIITAIDPAADTKTRMPTAYGAYGSYGSGSGSY